MSCSTCSARAILGDGGDDFESGCGKLRTFDWLKDIPESEIDNKYIEVRFKNTHKDFFINRNNISVKRGDYVAVETERGHNIGQVTLTGRLASLQLKRKKRRNEPDMSIYRKANQTDLEKWHLSRLKEKPTMLKARQIASELKLDMKISDVEYQGDGTKAIFYYIADDRIDFRELIKRYAKEFGIRIEMKQIGARQEAAMVGGIGSCGKELCCSSWRTDLTTVLSNAAKIQELPHNAQKLTGQCGKLKCCLMYELDSYLEAQSDFPDMLLELETEQGIAYPKKKDLLNKIIYYSYSPHDSTKAVAVHLSKVKEIINLNKRGIKPATLNDNEEMQSVSLSFVSSESDPDIISKQRPKAQYDKRKAKKTFQEKNKKHSSKRN
jgi:cell fate regulator YaaT (PSP1 superfamily)